MECLICGSARPPVIKTTRIQSFKEASLIRKDGLGDKIEHGATEFLCHRNCISTYCSKHHLKRVVEKHKLQCDDDIKDQKKSRRGKVFSFREHCIFCGDVCEIERPKKNPKRWKEAYLCRIADRKGKATFKEAISKRAKERNDG